VAGSAQGAYEKGQRLAKLVGGQRLLILDGVEPLQYPPSSPTGSQLKDQGVEALLKGLAASSNGLCIVTTRYSIPDLAAFVGSTWHEEELKRLSREAGVALLKDCGVKGSESRPDPTLGNPDPLNEYEQLVEDVKGHALTLQILGQYLKRAHHGDIRRRDRVELAKADLKVHASHGFGTGHAFRAIAAYEAWLADDSEESRRELAVLRLLGLFDRPTTADCVQTLRQPPAIDGLTDPLVGLSDEDWEFTLTTLSDARLVSVNRDAGTGELVSLDAHPLIREYFAGQLRRPDQAQRRSGNAETDDHADAGASSQSSSIRPKETSEVWRAAHRRLYEHLCETTNEGDQPTLEELQPLYQAVAHECHAGLRQNSCDDVYYTRILKQNENYSTFKLGALASDLGAIAYFFESPWSGISSALTEADQAWLLNESAFSLRALGRLTESLEPMRPGLDMRVKQKDWGNAARSASNLSELELTLGEVSGALSDAERSVTYADRSGDADWSRNARVAHADALHQSGRVSEAESLFREAEQMQAESTPANPLLPGIAGFRYCDLLLAAPSAPRGGWFTRSREEDLSVLAPSRETLDALQEVSARATQTLKWAEQNNVALLDIALDHLTLSRAALYESLLSGSAISHSASPLSAQSSEIEAAVSGLRRAGQAVCDRPMKVDTGNRI
jgi:tetratricopeptide (TPR) repeat protein